MSVVITALNTLLSEAFFFLASFFATFPFPLVTDECFMVPLVPRSCSLCRNGALVFLQDLKSE